MNLPTLPFRLLTAACVATVVATSCQSATAVPAEGGTGDETDLGGREVLIGSDATYRPFEFVEGNTIVGIDPDLMAAICELANCRPRFVNTAWDGIFAALAAGEFDALMSAITILPDRAAQSDATFTDPYFEVGQVVMVLEDSPITSTEDLADAVVAVQIGTTGEFAAVDELGIADESVRRHDTIVLAVQALLNGDADAVVLDNPTAEVSLAQNPGALRLLGAPFTTEEYGILVANSAPEVLTAFNAAIAQLKSEGRIDLIVGRWYTETAPEG
jgi:polar amino acid transport system substrate-binding protein